MVPWRTGADSPRFRSSKEGAIEANHDRASQVKPIDQQSRRRGRMRVKQLIKSAIRNVGFDITRIRPTRQDFMQSRSIDTVIDVGANEGQFVREIRENGYSGRIVSFELIKEIYSKLANNVAKDQRWKGFNLGLSNRSGHAVIGVSEHTGFSSMHELTKAASIFEERSRVVRSETIKLRTLEELSDEIEGARLFLKIDTQGHEQACLEGVGKLARRIEGVQLELPLSALYDNVWTFGEAVSFMKQLGYVPCYFSPVAYQTNDPLAMVEVDCIFRRYNAEFD
jgi:FkbM family methyltransferase